MEQDTRDRLHDIIERYGFAPANLNALARYMDPFDVSKPNFHDSKAEFLAERQRVDDAVENVVSLLDFFMSAHQDKEERDASAANVFQGIDRSSQEKWRDKVPDTIADMINKNASETNLSYNLIFPLIDVLLGLRARRKELEVQEATYWSRNSRAPDYYARSIALRFARLVAQNTGQKPTTGTSRDGSHPSTDFGRALEEIFQLLGIETNFRHPSIWAVKQLTDSDAKPPEQTAMGGLMGYGVLNIPPSDVIREVKRTISKSAED